MATVLVVDDEAALARMVSAYLMHAGHETVVVHDGLTAVEQARAIDPDVMVLDLGLPGLDGVEVCRQVRTFSDCYVIMLTARDDELDRLVGLSVADTGEGLRADQLPHIFERFWRADSARDRDRGGSGIGPPIAKAIAEAHHGTLSAASPGFGEGVTVTLTLPANTARR